MSYIQLPIITYKKNLEKHINFSYSNVPPKIPVMNKTLYSYLTSIKGEIDNCQAEWDRYKKYMNTYEYIHTPVSGSLCSICKLTPLSRSYYKMIDNIDQNGDIINVSNNSGRSDDPVPPSSGLEFKDYVFTSRELPPFTAFQIKIDMVGTNQAQPQFIKELRAIALA